jgi:hypothetical protein
VSFPRLSRGARLALALFLLAPVGAAAQDRQRSRVYVDEAHEGDRALFGEVETSLARGDHDRAAEILDGLLGRAAGAEGSLLVEVAPEHFRSLAVLAFERALALPPEAKARLQALEEGGAKTFLADKPLSEETLSLLVRRFPFAAKSAGAARRLADLAFEAGDDPAACSWDRRAAKLSGEVTLSALARQAIVRARSGDKRATNDAIAALERAGRERKADESALQLAQLARRTLVESERLRIPEPPASGLVLRPLGVAPLARDDPQGREEPRCEPARTERFALASSGLRLVALDLATGKLAARLPIGEDGSTPPAPGVQTRPTVLGNLILAPLLSDRWLVEFRDVPAKGEDPAIFGGYFSLFAFEASGQDLRVAWCEDGGSNAQATRQDPRPPGFESGEAETIELLRRGHLAGPVVTCGRRIYLPLVKLGPEPELSIVALELRTGDSQSFAPRPLWRTFVSSAPRPPAKGTELPPVACELAVDPEGHLIVSTDQGIVASIAPATGTLEWVVRFAAPPDPNVPPRGVRVFRPQRLSVTPLGRVEPPLVVARPAKPSVALVVANWPEDGQHRVLAFDVETGAVAWNAKAGEATRLLPLANGAVLAYGGRTIAPLDAPTGCCLFDPPFELLPDEQVQGSATLLGANRVLLPTGLSGARLLEIVVKREDATGRWVEVGLELSRRALELTNLGGPPSLLAAGPTRLIAATAKRLAVFEWVQDRPR